MLLTACGGNNEPASNSTNAKRYDMRGKVVSTDRINKRARIAHEKIPGFMDAMTMEFPIREDWVWNELVPGAEIRADLVVDSSAKDPYWLENIAIVGAPIPGQEAPAEKAPEQIGKTGEVQRCGRLARSRQPLSSAPAPERAQPSSA